MARHSVLNVRFVPPRGDLVEWLHDYIRSAWVVKPPMSDADYRLCVEALVG